MNKLALTACILLGLAFADMPYGYYTFLRIAVCLTGIALAARLIIRDESVSFISILMMGIAIAYNPIIEIDLSRYVWSWVNGVSVLLFLLYIINNKEKKDLPAKDGHPNNGVLPRSKTANKIWRKSYSDILLRVSICVLWFAMFFNLPSQCYAFLRIAVCISACAIGWNIYRANIGVSFKVVLMACIAVVYNPIIAIDLNRHQLLFMNYICLFVYSAMWIPWKDVGRAALDPKQSDKGVNLCAMTGLYFIAFGILAAVLVAIGS